MYNMNETIFDKNYMISVERPNNKIENISLIDLMEELYFINHNEPVYDLNVVWEMIDDEIHIREIYDNDSGEVYWSEPSDEEWTDEDDELTNSLLMWGGLENTIGEYYV